MLNFARVRRKEISITDLIVGLGVDDLHKLIDEMVDTELSLVADATDADVVFMPIDPAAHDTYASRPEDEGVAWTLGHVIVHSTASAEEGAALSTELARGVEIKGRSRYEVPWETVTTAKQIRQRLEESRRMRHAFLNAWPDEPNLSITYEPRPGVVPFNAIRYFINGLSHADSHLDQIREIMRQSRAARR